ncbi:IclR family transcriptional regulator [Falsirhodobacter algicola]|uniref:Helix-turn-helix domain-containing protein n=1 Tax=Falsirhodobacter algicola TaxID=2692330 RepID=A0A8J8MVD1_9RHOB|nr:IclR family transcriptional regulator [Falsirhodobacter algicola]QUS37116.1 helix-turn-helix domain-containing protein [Falsirhodobacter algicola]
MDYLSVAYGSTSATDLSRAFDIPKSTLHGLLTAMEELELIRRDTMGRVSLGPRPLVWTRGFISKSNLVNAFHQHFDTAGRTANDPLSQFTITMTVLDGNDVVYIACSQANQPLGVTFQIGMRLPAPFTATGKAQLANLSEADLSTRFAEAFPEPLTQYSVRNWLQLRQQLDQIRARGYSVDDGEIREGMICLGATIRNHDGKVCAGLALSLTRTEAKAAKIEVLGKALTRTAGDISHLLGAPGRKG